MVGGRVRTGVTGVRPGSGVGEGFDWLTFWNSSRAFSSASNIDFSDVMLVGVVVCITRVERYQVSRVQEYKCGVVISSTDRQPLASSKTRNSLDKRSVDAAGNGRQPSTYIHHS